ncbi:MAG TPA: ATP-binding protein [Alphaproteobacteria bacterium]|nr:ATP-binding protein [Alphaproteobacteria bacterium]
MPEIFGYLPAVCGLLLALLVALVWKLRRLTLLLNRQAAELRAARKHEALGTLAGGIAHDFNNILGAILGFGVLLEEDLMTAPEQQDMAKQITAAARRGQGIVAQLMRYSRRGNTDSRQPLMPISLHGVIDENIALLAPCIRKSVRIGYRRDTANGEDIIIADAVQIGQVLVNLCLNADHAIGVRTGHIHVTLDRTHIAVPCGDENGIAVSGGNNTGDTVTLINGYIPAGDYARIRVEDDGEGMTRDTAVRIFEPFFTTRDVGSGTGLGLAALQGIMQDGGGGIIVTTTRFKGTVFELLFPPAAQDGAS